MKIRLVDILNLFKRKDKKKKLPKTFLKESEEVINGYPFKRYEFDHDAIKTALDHVPNDKFLDVMGKLLDAQRERHQMIMNVLTPMALVADMISKDVQRRNHETKAF